MKTHVKHHTRRSAGPLGGGRCACLLAERVLYLGFCVAGGFFFSLLLPHTVRWVEFKWSRIPNPESLGVGLEQGGGASASVVLLLLLLSSLTQHGCCSVLASGCRCLVFFNSPIAARTRLAGTSVRELAPPRLFHFSLRRRLREAFPAERLAVGESDGGICGQAAAACTLSTLSQMHSRSSGMDGVPCRASNDRLALHFLSLWLHLCLSQ